MEYEDRRSWPGLISWLQGLVAERISSALTLVVSQNGAKSYRLVSDGKMIEMPVWRWPVGSDDVDMGWFYPAREGLESVIDDRLPAPGPSSLSKRVLRGTSRGYFINYDILGLTYWVLSRAEEIGRTDVDEHGRFPATASHAYRHTYLDRPVVDEWFAVLKQLVERLWPRMPVVENAFQLHLSHDVDQPSAFAFRSMRQMCKSTCGDVVMRRDLQAAVRRPWVWCRSRERLHRLDPYNTFDWLMDMSDRNNVQSAFYFVCGRTDMSLDPEYEVAHPAIRELLRRIHSRGHEIGLHPSYGTYRAPALIGTEAQRLFSVCRQEQICQERWGSRMHYLRWAAPDTWYGLQSAGLEYDSSVGYADRPGFRCGTSLEYAAFDAVAWQPLRLRIRPLIAMDCTVIDKAYMSLGLTDSAADAFISLKRRCRQVGGGFSLLWHNSQLSRHDERELYESILAA